MFYCEDHHYEVTERLWKAQDVGCSGGYSKIKDTWAYWLSTVTYRYRHPLRARRHRRAYRREMEMLDRVFSEANAHA